MADSPDKNAFPGRDIPPHDAGEFLTVNRPEDENIRLQGIEHFIRQLADDDEVTRWRSAEALGRIGDPAAVEPLIDALWDEDARVRLKAAWALGAIGDPRAIPALRKLYRIEKEETQEIIQEALNAIGTRSRPG